MTPHDDLEQRLRHYLERRAQAPVPPPGPSRQPSGPRGRVVRAIIAAAVVAAVAGGSTAAILVTRRPTSPPVSPSSPTAATAVAPTPTATVTSSDCTAQTVRTGEVTNAAGFSTAGTALWFVTVPIRATSGTCTLVLPDEIAVASTEQGPFHDVSLALVTPTSMVLSNATWSTLVFGDSWPLPKAEPPIAPGDCSSPFADVNVLEVPIGDSSLEVSTGVTWSEVCQGQGPAKLGVTLQGT
jgi:hypothetical protein